MQRLLEALEDIADSGCRCFEETRHDPAMICMACLAVEALLSEDGAEASYCAGALRAAARIVQDTQGGRIEVIARLRRLAEESEHASQ